jgi:hypothetical protein
VGAVQVVLAHSFFIIAQFKCLPDYPSTETDALLPVNIYERRIE